MKGGGVVHINDYVSNKRGLNPSAQQRKEFITWMFDNILSMRSSSKSMLAKTLVDRYRCERGISINKEWT